MVNRTKTSDEINDYTKDVALPKLFHNISKPWS